jgi:uncharacterized protein (UPF0303 family)
VAVTIESELRRVEAGTKDLVWERFSNDDALALGLAVVEKARARGLGVAVDVERGGQRLFHFAMEGTSPDNASWIERKKNVVKRVFVSSYAYGLKLAAEGKTLHDLGLDPSLHAAHGGCVPIVVKGTGVVGMLTISGLPQKDDHDLAVEVMREQLGLSGGPSPARAGSGRSRRKR